MVSRVDRNLPHVGSSDLGTSSQTTGRTCVACEDGRLIIPESARPTLALLSPAHTSFLRVIDADIRRAEEEGFAADAKVASAREVLRRLERARDDARRRHAVLIARRKMANVTTRALAERDAALRTPAAAPEPSPSPTFATACPPPPSRQAVDAQGAKRSRGTSGGFAPPPIRRDSGAPRAARRAPTIPTPASPKSRNPPRRAASPRSN